ncbi:MAG TPA: serine/threonine protein kinase, partial [Anaerolineae bacterium]|nr:serine/threonine protein kinase [Anaerolineae bacterium]
MTLSVGQVLQNRYRVTSLLGQGGMGAVYRAWDARLEISVALKEMVPQPGLDSQTLAQLRRQFQQEATVLARLHHPNLVRVTDFFEEGGNAYLVMDFVEGESLGEIIARMGALDEKQVLIWAQQLLDALAYCHARGVIHRDIKPQNVIINPDGQAVLVDFGLVKLWNPNDPRTRTAMRGMGTPEYAPPEQYDAQGAHTDSRSDIYSLGATLYHALTGQSPPTATMRIANPALFATPRAVNPAISPTTEAAILRATELSLERRFANAAEMAAALRGEEVPSPPPVVPHGVTRVMGSRATVATPPPTAAPPRRRRRFPVWGWIVGGLVLLLLGAV